MTPSWPKTCHLIGNWRRISYDYVFCVTWCHFLLKVRLFAITFQSSVFSFVVGSEMYSQPLIYSRRSFEFDLNKCQVKYTILVGLDWFREFYRSWLMLITYFSFVLKRLTQVSKFLEVLSEQQRRISTFLLSLYYLFPFDLLYLFFIWAVVFLLKSS